MQILRERVAVGRKLVEAITAALPARRVEAVATTPLGQRSRRAKGEPALQRSSSAATPKPSGAPGLPLKPVMGSLGGASVSSEMKVLTDWMSATFPSPVVCSLCLHGG